MGLTFEEPKGLEKLKLKVIEGLIVEEKIADEDIVQERRAVCASCDQMDEENMKCLQCGCFLHIKTQSKVNVKKNLVGSEITHCPLNKWLDRFSQYGYSISHDTK